MYPIRPATIEDSKEIARLAGQLGYSTRPDTMRQRLQRLVNSGADLVLVAEISREELAGWIHANRFQQAGVAGNWNDTPPAQGNSLTIRVKLW